MQPLNQNQGFSFSCGALRQPYNPAIPSLRYVYSPLKAQDSFQYRTSKTEKCNQSPWYITVGKEILKTSLVIAASVAGGVFGNVPGAMAAGSVTSAAVSMVDQKLSKGKIDWGTVAIDVGLGLIPGGFGNKLVQSGEWLLSKIVGKTISAGTLNTTRRAIVKGATDGILIGYIGGGAQSAYDSYRKEGKVNWKEANMAGAKSILPGMIGGGLAAGCVTAAGRKLAIHSAQKSKTNGIYELPAMPTEEELKRLKPPKRTWANRLISMLFQRSEDTYLSNLHKVDEHVLRGAMPESEADFTHLKNHHNVHTIIDLRGPATTKAQYVQYEMGHCKKNDIKYISIPMSSTRAPNQEELQLFLAAIQEAKAANANGKVYVHCKHGIDRTGAMIAAYEVAVNKSQIAQHIIQKEAFKRMQQYGYNTFHEWSRPEQKTFVLSPELLNILKIAQQGAEIRIKAQNALNRKALPPQYYEQLLGFLNLGQIDQARAILENKYKLQ